MERENNVKASTVISLSNNKKTGTAIRHTLTHLFIIALGLLMIYPILWMVVSSFKPNNMIFSDPGLIPKAVTIENYITGWKGYAGTSFGGFFINSLLMCAVAIVGNLISCSMAAFAFARLKFAGRGFWFAVMMITLMLPGHVTTVPRYILFNTFGRGPFSVLGQAVYRQMTNYVLISVPLFIFMAALLERCGIARDMYTSLNQWLSRTRGGIAIVTALMAIVMAAMSGIIGGEVVLLGLIALPQMLRLGYDKRIAIGVVCAGGSLGTMIPPSIVLIFYGLTANVSIGELFAIHDVTVASFASRVVARRNRDVDHIQPEVQVLPEAPVLHRGLEIDVGGGYYPDVRLLDL